MVIIIRPHGGADRSLIVLNLNKQGEKKKIKCARKDLTGIKPYIYSKGREDQELVRACVRNGAAKGV